MLVPRRLVSTFALLATSACAAGGGGGEELRVWAFGTEGEALAPMMREFERANPGIHVRVQ